MEQFDKSAYMAEVHRRIEERLNATSNVTLNDIKCSNNSNTLNVTLNETSNGYIEKSKYIKMLRTLELWGCFRPKTLTFKYGVEHCYRTFEYVLNTPNVKNKGAYFRKMLAV